jgi:ribosome-associated protein
LEANELAHLIVNLISEKKGENIVLMDLQQVTPIAEYFVIAEGNNERLLRAIGEHIREKIKEHTKRIPLRTEGRGGSGWILMDYGDVVVHLFSPQLRAYYDLEALWADANILVRVQ